jgi:hypothetical protein
VPPYCILELEGSSKEYRKNWARLIQNIYEVDPLTCPKACPEPVEGCQGKMKIISLIEDREVIDIRLVRRRSNPWHRDTRKEGTKYDYSAKRKTHYFSGPYG